MTARSIRFEWQLARYCTAAVWYLALARVRFARQTSEQIIDGLQNGAVNGVAKSNSALDLEKMRIALGAVGARLPWRSDCMIQVLAAHYWLSAYDVETVARFGVRHGADGEFRAHAWLEVDGIIVTGGDVSGFAQFSPVAGAAG